MGVKVWIEFSDDGTHTADKKAFDSIVKQFKPKKISNTVYELTSVKKAMEFKRAVNAVPKQTIMAEEVEQIEEKAQLMVVRAVHKKLQDLKKQLQPRGNFHKLVNKIDNFDDEIKEIYHHLDKVDDIFREMDSMVGMSEATEQMSAVDVYAEALGRFTPR